MSDQLEPEVLMREISGLADRLGELRQAAAMPEPDLRTMLDAALVELDLALSALRTVGAGHASAGGRTTAAESERRVLRTVFQDAPVPLFLMDRDGGVRRVNQQAALLLGTSAGYVAGKPFIVFCDLSTRAALRSQLAAVVRTGERRQTTVRFLSKPRPLKAVVTLARAWIRGEPEPLVVAAVTPLSGRLPDPQPPERLTAGDEAAAAVVHRMDVLASASELLLTEPLFNEAVAIRRCARLLLAELADWVIVDLAGRTGFRRQLVFGPDDDRCDEIIQSLEAVDPQPGTLPYTVYSTRQTAVHAHVEDLDMLGAAADGTSACVLMGATSVLSVPIEDGEKSLGAITLTCGGENGPFDLLDLGVVQRLGRHLALVIRAARMYRRRAAVADTLQASLLPSHLPKVPGIDLAARYLGATNGEEVGGDFYDVFETTSGGWNFVLGDVCGKGEEAAAVTATARHGIRLLSRFHQDPGEVLTMVNEALLSEERFVTAVLVGLNAEGDRTATVSTAGHPPPILVRSDGVVRIASCGGVPLGVFDDFSPGKESIDLREGDTLLLHSDGVLDTVDVQGERFGQERLIEVLAANSANPASEMLLAVEHALMNFCDGDLRDDLSVLAVRVLPQTPL
ncbi:SpoIIE family protein phosphatase [Actinomadura sp. HBU206391]|uniref:SpoIIE family protein phosphatase n=1 Tax=Actinomadura sp. HBU206391 TaxID=2731692 RepID=UPI00164F5BBC|nr:SpoIIE family protein phosphatase [Actinomadura sp. HBU206391]MBC6460527.1 SpoIIE family protein phosphatase [Actinomadura sp. HBU206391]